MPLIRLRRRATAAILAIGAVTLSTAAWFAGAPETAAPGSTEPIPLVIETSAGNIDIVVFPAKAPITVANFLRYVDAGHYDGTIIHRIIKRQLIGFAGIEEDLTPRPVGDAIKNEADNGLMNDTGTLAMWRGLTVHGAKSEFYINLQNNYRYNHRGRTAEWFGNAVFGKVTSEIDPLILLSRRPHKAAPGYERLPKETIHVISIRRAEPGNQAGETDADVPG